LRELPDETARRGLNPNRWFNNVERVIAERIGRETVEYVSNIYKYYVAYTLAEERTAAASPHTNPRVHLGRWPDNADAWNEVK
jgi:membrane-bound lytic murein transglycosylase MltF